MSHKQKVLFSCDVAHDDFFAMLLGLFHPKADVIGVTALAGNQHVDKTTLNALNALNIVDKHHIDVAKGSQLPLFSQAHLFCPEIHGESGLDTLDKTFVWPPLRKHHLEGVNAVEYLAKQLLASGDEKIHVVATGPLTDVALLLKQYPQCIPHIAQISIMGGSRKEAGNTGLTAEFNIQVDPEAAKIVFSHGANKEEMAALQTQKTPKDTTIIDRVPIALIPLDVTHTTLVTADVLSRIEAECTITTPTGEVVTSPFGKLCCDLLQFFRHSYKTVFEFESPPLHDPVALFYALSVQHHISNDPTMPIDPLMIDEHTGETLTGAEVRPIFKTRHIFVDVETAGSWMTRGTTCMDYFGLFPDKKPNVVVAFGLDVEVFWNHFILALKRANAVSILNKQ